MNSQGNKNKNPCSIQGCHRKQGSPLKILVINSAIKTYTAFNKDKSKEISLVFWEGKNKTPINILSGKQQKINLTFLLSKLN